ncbi:MAG TPA: hypothetical protein VFC86_06710 [Planctomycetota bacterium]|nr:hypothetical protein [Planctomycetota bacterium]
MAKLAMGLAAAVFSLAAVQDEMIDNPEYQGWKSQKVGAWVKYKMTNDMGTMKMEGEVTSKLKELTAEKAVIDQLTIIEMMGKKHETPMTRPVPAKVKKGTDSEGAKVEILEEGDEELTIKEKKYKCHWVKMKTTNKGQVMNMKVWRNDQIVGGAARFEMTSEGDMKMTITMNVLDWKAGE